MKRCLKLNLKSSTSGVNRLDGLSIHSWDRVMSFIKTENLKVLSSPINWRPIAAANRLYSLIIPMSTLANIPFGIVSKNEIFFNCYWINNTGSSQRQSSNGSLWIHANLLSACWRSFHNWEGLALSWGISRNIWSCGGLCCISWRVFCQFWDSIVRNTKTLK